MEDVVLRDYEYYEARANAKDVILTDITSDEDNADILAWLRDNDPWLDCITITASNYEENGYVVRKGDDTGWLGYFVGKSKHLRTLYIDNFPGSNINLSAFLEGLGHNRSIETLQISVDLMESFQSMIPFLRNNDSLRELGFNSIDIGLQCARNIAFLLGQSNSLKRLEIYDTGLEDEGLVEILTAVRHTQIEELSMPSNYNLGREGYAALGRMLEGSTLSLLNVGYSDIEDKRLCALVAGLRNCHNLTSLNLNGNESITEAGLRSLSTLFQSDNCQLEEIDLDGMNIGDDGLSILAPGLATLPSLLRLNLFSNSIGNQGLQALMGALASCNLTKLSLSYNRLITVNGLVSLLPLLRAKQCTLCILDLCGIHLGDEGATALANGLRGNKSLTALYFNVSSITARGWAAFSRLLCDKTSVNYTYLSNHTIEDIGCGYKVEDGSEDTPQYIQQYLKWNKSLKQAAAICKILDSHTEIDVTPLFQFNLKCLPLVVTWLEKAMPYLWNMNTPNTYESTEYFQCRQLSAVYKFIRGVPLLVVDGYHMEKTKDIQSDAKKKRKFGLTL